MTSRSPWGDRDIPVETTASAKKSGAKDRSTTALGDVLRGGRNILIAIVLTIVGFVVFDPPMPINQASSSTPEASPTDDITTDAEEVQPQPSPTPRRAVAVAPLEETWSGTDVCRDQDIINQALPAFQKAYAGVALEGLNLDEMVLIGMARANRPPSRYKFMNIRLLGFENDGPGAVTVRCGTNFRVLDEVPDSDGTFWSYVQFNGSRYTIRMRGLDTGATSAYFLAELNPDGGDFDVTSGTE